MPGAYPDEEPAGLCGLCGGGRRRVGERASGEGEGGVGGGRMGRGGRAGGREGREGEDAVREKPTAGLSRLFRRRKRERVAQTSSTSTASASAAVDCSRWMSFLPDEAKLDELYLPGTHESLALYFPLLGSICQTTSLTSQLRGGIRFLDFRFSLLPLSNPRAHSRQFEGKDGEKWELRAYHGILTQLRGAEDAFEEVYRWLETEGRGETVIISCKQENATPSTAFAATLWALLERSKDKWYTDERWPSLGEVRGKCVMFCRFHFDGRGLHPPIWPNDNLAAWSTEIGQRQVVVQDWYGLPSLFSIPQKAALALSLFDASSSSPSSSFAISPPSPSCPTTTPTPTLTSTSTPTPTPLRLNFLSAASLPFLPPSLAAKGFGWPRWRAGVWGVNDLFLRGVEERERRGVRVRRKSGEGGMVVVGDFWESTGTGGGEGGSTPTLTALTAFAASNDDAVLAPTLTALPTVLASLAPFLSAAEADTAVLEIASSLAAHGAQAEARNVLEAHLSGASAGEAEKGEQRGKLVDLLVALTLSAPDVYDLTPLSSPSITPASPALAALVDIFLRGDVGAFASASIPNVEVEGVELDRAQLEQKLCLVKLANLGKRPARLRISCFRFPLSTALFAPTMKFSLAASFALALGLASSAALGAAVPTAAGTDATKRAAGDDDAAGGLLDIDLGGVDLKRRFAKREGPVTGIVNSLTTELDPLLSSLGLGSVADALSESTISVSAANDDGLANVTIIGAGALEGVKIVVPVAASTGEPAGAPQYYKAE
ncbi:hypothetical protein JCM6882_006525 [Rhodosporidiobolus microsporus]